MKRLVAVVFVSLFVSPAFAQNGLGGGMKKIVNPAVVERTVFNGLPTFYQTVKINNFNGHPVVPLFPVNGGVASASFLDPSKQIQTIQARVLEPDELRKIIFPGFQIYVPSKFIQAEESFYRGMKLSEWSELDNILKHGLEMNKSHYVGEIFTSADYDVAIGYMLPTIVDNWHGERQVDMPVVVRISRTEKLLRESELDRFGTQWIFRKDVPAEMLSDVMVFLEVNGKPGWYKAFLNEGKVCLSPEAGQQIHLPVLSTLPPNSAQELR